MKSTQDRSQRNTDIRFVCMSAFLSVHVLTRVHLCSFELRFFEFSTPGRFKRPMEHLRSLLGHLLRFSGRRISRRLHLKLFPLSLNISILFSAPFQSVAFSFLSCFSLLSIFHFVVPSPFLSISIHYFLVLPFPVSSFMLPSQWHLPPPTWNERTTPHFPLI